jgi:hypothetical protein
MVFSKSIGDSAKVCNINKRQRVNDLRQGSLACAAGLYFRAFSPNVALSD